MANEITVNTSVTVLNGSLSASFAPATYSVDQANARLQNASQTVGTSEEVIDFGDIATEGLVCLTNLGSNTITWGPESGGALVEAFELNAGETAGPLRVKSGVVFRAKAATADTDMQVFLLED